MVLYTSGLATRSGRGGTPPIAKAGEERTTRSEKPEGERQFPSQYGMSDGKCSRAKDGAEGLAVQGSGGLAANVLVWRMSWFCQLLALHCG